MALPIPPVGLAIAVGVFLMRSSLSGVVLGAIFTMAAFHLWPEMMQTPFAWVGQGLQAIGLQ
ncbi:hypothetical protein [Halomonas sp. E19]|jgi:hypothetical protein|uniref:hypothetical protein n=1 Tax=Halomonas sp. E19 TaxID=3397247 RepID=UPI004033A7D1